MKRSQDKPQILLDHHLKALRLPVFVREREKVAAQCVSEKAEYAEFLLRPARKGSTFERGIDCPGHPRCKGINLTPNW